VKQVSRWLLAALPKLGKEPARVLPTLLVHSNMPLFKKKQAATVDPAEVVTGKHHAHTHSASGVTAAAADNMPAARPP
jgi:hypothetical protein